MPSAICSSQLRSSSAQCDLGGEEGRKEGRKEGRQAGRQQSRQAGRQGGKQARKERKNEGRRRRRALIKSNNPHLTGGEKSSSVQPKHASTHIHPQKAIVTCGTGLNWFVLTSSTMLELISLMFCTSIAGLCEARMNFCICLFSSQENW